MDIEVGEYVRDRDGCIIKVSDIQEECNDIWYKEKLLRGTWKSMVTKHSRNIIDLIKVGDYVNGMLIVQVMKESFEDNKKTRIFANRDEKCMLKAIEITKIDTILTHEMYENSCYKLEE